MPSGKIDKPGRPGSRAAYWDTSAIVPLCCDTKATATARRTVITFPRVITWWVTRVEAVGAVNRLHRDEVLAEGGRRQALLRLAYLHDRWTEVQPSIPLRDIAERLLAVHALRSADALQLAAALVWCGSRARGRAFATGDGALGRAASQEGFDVIPIG